MPQGASPRELLLEASRRNNTSLLSEVLGSQSSSTQTAQLLNESKDGLGNNCLHLAASYGNCMRLSDSVIVPGLRSSVGRNQPLIGEANAGLG